MALFCLQLCGVIHCLPFAASADTEMLTEGYRAYITIFNKANDLAFGKRMLFTSYLNVADIARYAERYKYYQVFPMEKTLSLCSYGFYSNTLKEW